MRLNWIPAEMKCGFNASDYSIELKFGKSKTKFFLKYNVTSSSVGNTTPQKFSGVTQFTVSLHSFCLQPQSTVGYNIHLKVKDKNFVKLHNAA